MLIRCGIVNAGLLSETGVFNVNFPKSQAFRNLHYVLLGTIWQK